MKEEVIAAAVDLWASILSKPPSSNINDVWKDHLRIFDTLKQIEEHQTKFQFNNDRLSKLDEFLEWSEKMGIKYTGVGVRETVMGLSLVASEDLSDHSVIVKVPRHAIMSVESETIDEPLRYVMNTDQVVRSVDHVGLALILVTEMLKPVSEWKEYLSVLPPTYSTPLFFTNEQLLQMKPSPAFEESVLMYRTVARHFIYFFMRLVTERNLSKNKKKLLKNAPFARTSLTLQNFTFDLYKWCVSTVSTRINMIPSVVMGEQNELQTRMVPSLIPFMDLANHAQKSKNPGGVYFDVETNAVHLQLKSNVESNSEVFIYYGARTNRKFFVHNGFVPDDGNPDDFYELRLERNYYTFKLCHQEIEQDDSLEAPELNRVVEFSKVFVAQTFEDLKTQETYIKAIKFLSDRIGLILLGYKDLPVEENEEDVLIDKFIWRLKHSEKKILEGLLKILSHHN